MQDIYQVKIKDAYGKIHNLLGLKGDTPVKGPNADYWTDEDKVELKNEIINLLNKHFDPVGITEEKDINFNPFVFKDREPAYILKYESEDGENSYYLGNIIVDSEKVNRTLLSIDTNFEIYNDIGYKENYGLGNKYVETEKENYFLSGYIELKNDSKLIFDIPEGDCTLYLFKGDFGTNTVTLINKNSLISSSSIEGIQKIKENNVVKKIIIDNNIINETKKSRYIRIEVQNEVPKIIEELKNNILPYSYISLIKENIAPENISYINVYNLQNELIIPIEFNFFEATKEKLYSFGLISDIHLTKTPAEETGSVIGDSNPDANNVFNVILKSKIQSGEIQFICCCGDITEFGTIADFTIYREKEIDFTKCFVIPGNHDIRDIRDDEEITEKENAIKSRIQTYTSHLPYYYFEKENDIFIFMGTMNEPLDENGQIDINGNVFSDDEKQQFYNTLEHFKNKRCFVFQHINPDDTCGNALGIYKNKLWGPNNTEAIWFKNLISHYKNVIHFHGHSHTRLNLQRYTEEYKNNSNLSESAKKANIDISNGISIHVPSMTVPRDPTSLLNPEAIDVYSGSEGYIVDVYEDGIRLKGYNFVTNQPIPLAQYWIPTNIDLNVDTFNPQGLTYDLENNLILLPKEE